MRSMYEIVELKLTDDLIRKKDMTIFKPETHLVVKKLNEGH